MQPAKYCTLVFAAMLSFAAQADDEPGITPYRPSVSNSAQLPAPGQLELEFGGLTGKTDTTRRDSLPTLFKLAFNPQWGVLIGGESYVSVRDETGHRERGVGDVSLILKRAFLVDEGTAWGLEFGVKLPTAKDTIGSGHADYTVNGIYSKDLHPQLHMDANLNFTRMGEFEPGTARTQTGLSASFSTPLSEQWNATAELAGTRRSGTPETAQLLAALAYSPSKRLTLDFGFIRGLNKATPDWSFFTGVVMPVARLW